MHIHSLWVYPVKSLAGIPVTELQLDDFGPAGDRRWMIVDDEGKFVTQRSRPELARIGVAFKDGEVELDIPEQGRFVLSPTAATVDVLVWHDRAQAQPADASVNEALSRFCSQSLRFVFMPDDSFRRVDPERVSDRRRVSFADAFPFLVTNLASLEDLNTRLEQPVEMRRFRPNLVVQGAEPWAEDGWRSLQVGERTFALVKSCSRCVLTTVDPDTGLKDAGTQPLKTLSGFRRTNEGVIFGMNAIHDSEGRIRVGDPVTLSKTE